MSRDSGGSATPRGLGPSSSTATGSAQPRNANTFPGAAKYQQGMDLNNPNLANSIGAGRAAAVKDQGFRKGYDVTTSIGEPDEAGTYEQKITKMPKIKSDFAIGGSARNRSRRAS